MNYLIYKITNTVNTKVYIGQTSRTLQERMWEHCKPSGSCKYLCNAINKYGREKFSISLITITHTQEIADYWESHFISSLNSSNRLYRYNLRAGGNTAKFSSATRKLMSIAQKKRIRLPHSEETKKKIGMSNKGKKISDEMRKKISISLKKYFSMKGNKCQLH